MTQSKTIRTIESVLNLDTGNEISSEYFFSKAMDEIFRFRYELESAIRKKEYTHVCYFCRQPVKIRGKVDSKRIFHFSHLRDSDACPIKTGNKYTKEEILKIKYNGAKESQIHIELKNFIAEYLTVNKRKSNGIEKVEIEAINKHIDFAHVWKRPDVSSIYKGKRLVFELQLSTTFLSVINSRQEFYKENKTYILWVFNSFETNDEKRKFTQSDVFYNNNRNGFELDISAKSKSQSENDLVLKCHYQKPLLQNKEIIHEWKEEYVKLSDLYFNIETYQVYFYDYNGEHKKISIDLELSKFRVVSLIKSGTTENISKLFLNGYKVTHPEQTHINNLYKEFINSTNESIEKETIGYRIIWAILLIKLGDIKLINILVSNMEVQKTVIDILSLKIDKIVGCSFKKQIQIAHRILDTRKEYMTLYLKAINHYRPNLFKDQDVSGKLQLKIDKLTIQNPAQVSRFNNIFLKIFPELKDEF